MFQKPEQEQKIGGCGLQKQGEVNVVSAETHAVFPELRAPFLIDGFDLLGDRVALQDAEILAKPEGDASREPRDLFGFRDFNQRLQPYLDVMGEPSLDPGRDVVLVDGGKVLVGIEREIRLEGIVPRREPPDLLTLPNNLAFPCK